MQMKKVFTVLLAMVCMLTGCLSGCGIKKAVVKIPLYRDTEAQFIIVRAEDDTEGKVLAEKLRDKIKSKLDITANIRVDKVEHTDGQLEVNIGMTNRPDVQEVYKKLSNENGSNANDFIVEKRGDFVYVIGMTESALSLAIDFFINKFCLDPSVGIREDYSFLYNYEYTDEDIYNLGNGVNIGEYKIITPKYNMSYIVGKEVIELENAVLEKGYKLPSVTDAEKESECEIIIDACNRSGVKKITDEDEFHITLEDKKIYIYGGSALATGMAVKRFTEMIKNKEEIQANTDIKGSYKEEKQKYAGLYSVTVKDDFNGDRTNDDLWYKWTYPSNPEIYESEDKKTIFYNYRDPKNITVSNGMLKMKAYIGEKTVENGVTKQNIYSAKMETKNNFWFQYGYLEFSAKAIKGKGLGSTFWTHGDDSKVGNLYSEFDLPEFYGDSVYYRACPLIWKREEINGVRKNKGGVFWGSHTNSFRGYNIYTLQNNEPFSETFHTYGLEWDKDWFRFIVDGRVIYEFNYSQMTEDEVFKGWTKTEMLAAYRSPSNILISIKAGAYTWSNLNENDWINDIINVAFEDRPRPEDIYDKKFDGEDDTLTVDYMALYQKKGQYSGTSANEVRNKVEGNN